MKRSRTFFLGFIDVIIILFSYYIALWLRFDGEIPLKYYDVFMQHSLVIVAIKMGTYIFTGLYRILWRYGSVKELIRVVMAAFISNFITAFYLIITSSGIPRSIFAIVLMLDILFLGGIRLLDRILSNYSNRKSTIPKKRVLILGAGEAGALVLEEIQRNPHLPYQVIGFIDDDDKKKGKTIHGVSVIGDRTMIGSLVSKYFVDEIIFAMPSADPEDRKDYIERATLTGAKVKTIPGIYEIIDNKVNLSMMRDVQIEDLLGRESIKLNDEKLKGFLQDKVVMVTGGGGSIGSEIARQVAKYRPKQLALVDIYENNVYDLQLELKKYHPELDLAVLIDSVRNYSRMDALMKKYRPEIVFHAAAHKHVPLMEDSPQSAVLNNVLGTYNMVILSDLYEVENFVMISTDKAVNPTNIMGATKRIGEKIVQAHSQVSKTKMVAVRFGNVLGSSGSVIPLFKQQIKDGGPITVTHEDINRYFMTIPEACQLVLQAGSIAKGGEIYILDMGKPVRIMDLARDLIRLSGLKEDVDIKIEVTGLRPGEKLYEELLLNKEKATRTEFDKIFIENLLPVELINIEEQIRELMNITQHGTRGEILDQLHLMVPSFHHNGKRDES